MAVFDDAEHNGDKDDDDNKNPKFFVLHAYQYTPFYTAAL